MHVIAAKAIAFKEAMEPSFKKYQEQVLKNAKCMVNTFMTCGYKVVSNNTYNHLFLVDLTDKNITGKEAEFALGLANITVNKNSIPNDQKSPFITSGIRIGTPSITRRGLKENEAKILSYFMINILDNIKNIDNINKIKDHIVKICIKYPVY
jgi:glycine hydroxymethyltransferase